MDEADNPSEGSGALSLDDVAGLLDTAEENLTQATSEADTTEATGEAESTDKTTTEDVVVEAEDEADTDAEDTTEEVEEPELYTIKVDGEEQQVTLDELRMGYQRELKFKQGTAENAELRRQLESERAEAGRVMQEAQASAQYLQNLVPHLEQNLRGKWANTDWRQAAQTMDPRAYQAARAEFEADVAQYQQVQQAIGNAQQQRAQAAAVENQREKDVEWGKLVEAIPEFGDTQKRPAKEAEMTAYLADIGVENPQKALKNLSHAVHFQVIADAMRYRQSQASVDKAKAKAKPQKVAKPGRNPRGAQDSVDALKSKLQRTGSLDDAVALMMAEDQ